MTVTAPATISNAHEAQGPKLGLKESTSPVVETVVPLVIQAANDSSQCESDFQQIRLVYNFFLVLFLRVRKLIFLVLQC